LYDGGIVVATTNSLFEFVVGLCGGKAHGEEKRSPWLPLSAIPGRNLLSQRHSSQSLDGYPMVSLMSLGDTPKHEI
ncbi:MAG: hypothetical protein ACRD3O_24220, partial [Terriglobia bacterium]